MRRFKPLSHLIIWAALACQIAWAVSAATGHRWVAAAGMTALFLFGWLGPYVGALTGAIVAVFLAQPLAVAAFALLSTVRALPRILPLWALRPRTEPARLAAALENLPTPLTAELAALAGRHPISTMTLVTAAAAGAPPWNEEVRAAAPPWDGYLLTDRAGRTWTSIAAEAVILARAFAADADDVPIRLLLGAASLMLPESAAAEAAAPRRTGPIAVEMSGLSLPHLAAVTARFGSGRDGADAARRAELVLMAGENKPPNRARLFTASNRQLLIPWVAHLVRELLAGASMPLLVVAVAVAAPFASAGRIWRGLKRRGSRTKATLPTTDPRPSKPGLLASYRRWLRETARSTSWPSCLALRVLRPMLTIAAAALVLTGDRPWWVLLPACAVPLVFRPLRRWWLDALIVGAGLYLGLVSATCLILLRLVVTASVLGHRGIESTVVGPRRKLATKLNNAPLERLQSPDEAWTRYVRLPSTDSDVYGLDYVAAVWATADGPALIRAFARVARMELSTRAPIAIEQPQLLRRMRGLVLLEAVTNGALRLGVAGAGVATALLVGSAGPARVAGVEFDGRWLNAVVAGVIALCIVQRKPGYVLPAFLAVAALICTHFSSLPALGVDVGGAGIAGQARAALTRRMANAPYPLAWVGRRVTGLRRRVRFKAALGLAARGRPGVAMDVLSELFEQTRRHSPSLAAVAAAGCTLIEMDRGNLQRSLEHAGRAQEAAGRSRSRVATAICGYAYGTAQFSLGDYAAAAAALCAAEPLLRRRPEGSSCLSLMAQSYSALGQPNQTLAVARSLSGRLTTPGRLLALVESEVAAAWVLLRAGRPEEVRELVDIPVDLFGNLPHDPQVDPDPRTKLLWWRALGQASLLLGRALLAQNDVEQATQRVGQAVERFRMATSHELLGVAKIYQGDCRRHSGQWSDSRAAVKSGIELLESRRGRLRTGVDRAVAVSAGLEHYDTALSVLVDAQSGADAEAGLVAAELIESLRRNALAELLRRERSAFAERLDAQARKALEDIAHAEEVAEAHGPSAASENGPDPGELRATLASKMSEVFAEAYLPEDVDYLRLSDTAATAHILQFELVEATEQRWRGYRTWAYPGHVPRVEEVVVEDPDALEVLQAVRHGRRATALVVPVIDMAQTWIELGRALLPPGLRYHLGDHDTDDPLPLLIVPGEHLAYLPWAALLLDDETTLLHKAVIQIVPSLNLLRPATPAIVGGKVLAYIDDEAAEQLDKGDAEVAYWRRLDSAVFLTRARTRAEFERELSSSSWDGLYLVAHGDGDGLAQGIKFTEGGTLSAATALTHRWPRSIVFASCFVAKVEQPSGREPFGLAIACMLGGCRTMVSGVIEVERAATSIIAADVTVALNSAAPAATSLRSAQLSYLESVGIELAFVNQWAGLICLSTEWSTAPR